MTRGRAIADGPRGAAIAVSAALHVLVLAWLGQAALSRLSAPTEAQTPAFTIELLRPAFARRAPTPPEVEAAAPRPASATARPLALAPSASPPAAPAPQRASPVPPSPLAPLTSPAAPPAPARGPAMGPIGAAGAQGPPAPPTVRVPAGPEANLGGLLREAVGCGHDVWMRLSAAERARCDKGFAAAAAKGERFPLPDDKLAGFAAQAAANERKRASREGSLPNTLPPCDPAMVGSNLLPSCLPKEAMHTVLKF